MDQAAVVSRAGRGSAARSVFTMLMNWASVAQVTEGEVELQPALVGERGDHHLGAVDADDLPLLHRQTSLLAAGVRVAAGSDAPVTSVDPWRAIATAADRHTRSGAVVGASERVDPAIALGWFLTPLADPGGPPRRVEVGESADLCLLDAPLATMLAAPDASHVRATWIDAQMVHP